MRLEKLHLMNFKNYEAADLEFDGRIHCFLGKNGSGKTNLLDAIHYLCFTRSAWQMNDAGNVRHGENHFLINGRFEKEGKHFEVGCTFAEGKKKMADNGKEYSRFSQHIGKYPLVLVAPADIELIWGGGETRRKFFDSLLAQLDKEFLEHLISYQAHLRQRNSLLKMFAERGQIDRDLIQTYDEKLVPSGNIIFRKRRDFIAKYLPLLCGRYAFLVNGSAEEAGLKYQSDLETLDFQKELVSRLERDVLIGRTTAGVHRDDFIFTLDGYELKKFGSQGQQKSFLIALKLAEYDSLKTNKGFSPLLLLDDIFDKLDDERIVQLMRLVADGTFNQIFLTDARPSRSLETLLEAGVASQNFLVDGGRISVMKKG